MGLHSPPLFLFQVKGSDEEAICRGLYLRFSEAGLAERQEEEGWRGWTPSPGLLMTDRGLQLCESPAYNECALMSPLSPPAGGVRVSIPALPPEKTCLHPRPLLKDRWGGAQP